MNHFRKLRIASIRNLRWAQDRARRSQRRLTESGSTAACSACFAGSTVAPAMAEAPAVGSPLALIETPAHINRLAWAWLREYQRDLQDDCDNRLETNRQ
jgi:hypothetical protein